MKNVQIMGLKSILILALVGITFNACAPVNETKQPETVKPTITAMLPADLATGVALNSKIVATFSEAINASTLTTDSFVVMEGATPVLGAVVYDDAALTATFTPTNPLTASTVFSVSVVSTVSDVVGNTLAATVGWSFTTGAAADLVAPTPGTKLPGIDAIDIGINSSVSSTFSEAIDPSTLNTTNFYVAKGVVHVAGAVSYDVVAKKATFTPSVALEVSTGYTVTITTGVKDLAGNALATNEIWNFTTAGAGVGPATVILGTASNFAILAKSAISTVPTSIITGDVGISPAARSLMTGFSDTLVGTYATSTQVTGSMYAANMAEPTPGNMTTSVSNMEAAYVDAAGRPTPDFTDMPAGALGGENLVPGLYKFTTAVTALTSFTLTGGANDVWIFQIPGNLTVSNAVTLTLAGGAQAKNIFWQVSGATNLGTTSAFAGNILCYTSITLQTGATLNGRALAQMNVALDQATVTKP